nr:MAG TPA: hypothetical protein [Caudoviricetes sp.]
MIFFTNISKIKIQFYIVRFQPLAVYLINFPYIILVTYWV